MNAIAGFQPKMKSEPVHGGHGGLGSAFAGEPAGDQQQGIRMIGVHVPDDFRAGFGQRIGVCASVLLRCHPAHHAEAADEVNARNLQPVIREVAVFLPVAGVLIPGEIQLANLFGGRFRGHAEKGHASRAQRVARSVGLGDQETGARIQVQVLRVHGHAADEEYRTAAGVGRVGHKGAEWEARDLAGMRGQAADAAEGNQGARTFGERRFGNLRRSGRGAGVLTGRHASMVREGRTRRQFGPSGRAVRNACHQMYRKTR